MADKVPRSWMVNIGQISRVAKSLTKMHEDNKTDESAKYIDNLLIILDTLEKFITKHVKSYAEKISDGDLISLCDEILQSIRAIKGKRIGDEGENLEKYKKARRRPHFKTIVEILDNDLQRLDKAISRLQPLLQAAFSRAGMPDGSESGDSDEGRIKRAKESLDRAREWGDKMLRGDVPEDKREEVIKIVFDPFEGIAAGSENIVGPEMKKKVEDTKEAVEKGEPEAPEKVEELKRYFREPGLRREIGDPDVKKFEETLEFIRGYSDRAKNAREILDKIGNLLQNYLSYRGVVTGRKLLGKLKSELDDHNRKDIGDIIEKLDLQIIAFIKHDQTYYSKIIELRKVLGGHHKSIGKDTKLVDKIKALDTGLIGLFVKLEELLSDLEKHPKFGGKARNLVEIIHYNVVWTAMVSERKNLVHYYKKLGEKKDDLNVLNELYNYLESGIGVTSVGRDGPIVTIKKVIDFFNEMKQSKDVPIGELFAKPKEKKKIEKEKEDVKRKVKKEVEILDKSVKFLSSSQVKKLYAESAPSFFTALFFGKIKILDRLNEIMDATEKGMKEITKKDKEIKSAVNKGDEKIKSINDDFEGFKKAKKMWKEFESKKDEILKKLGDGDKKKGEEMMESDFGRKSLSELLDGTKFGQYIESARAALAKIIELTFSMKKKIDYIEKELQSNP